MINLFKDEKKTTKVILFVGGLFILAYTISRACLLSITTDESHTFFNFVNKGIVFLSTYDRDSANNHFLNTWLMEITSKVFGNSELSLRLPNLIAHLFFIIYSIKLLSKALSKILFICSFFIINLNPFLLDFFSLARGYGLAVTLLMISLYYAYIFIVENRTYHSAFICVLFSALSVVANFTLIGYMIVTTCTIALINTYRIIMKKKEDNTKLRFSFFAETILILFPLSILFFIVPFIFSLNKAGAFYWGGDSGYWNDTVFSLITKTIYGNPFMSHLRNGFQIGIVLVLIVSLAVILIEYKKTKSLKRYSFVILLLLIILFCFLLSFLENKFLGILFHKERTALFYFPLFILLLAFLFNDLIVKRKRLIEGIIISFAVVFIVNFCASINFHYAISWKKEADTKELINYFTENKTTIYDGKKKIVLSIFRYRWLFVNDIKYYKMRYHLDWLNHEGYYEENKNSTDFVFADKADIDSIKNPSLKLVKDYPFSNMQLYSKNGYNR